MEAIIPGCNKIAQTDATLLGAALGATAVSARISKRAVGLRDMGARLATVQRHDALSSLRVSLGLPRAIFEPRAGASFLDPITLVEYDSALRTVVESSINVNIDDLVWRQCTLPPDLEV